MGSPRAFSFAFAAAPSRGATLLLSSFSALLAFFASGCTPHIGDKCTINTDCSISNTRQCDTSQPGGYCTIFSCSPNSCPDNAACVLFGDSVPGCPYDDYSAPARTGRTFCMETCQSDSDCRHDDGYFCKDVTSPPWSARVVDDNRAVRVCVLASDALETSAGEAGPPPVCPGGVTPRTGADAAVGEAGGEGGGPGADAAVDAPEDAPAEAADGTAGDATSDAAADAAPDVIDATADATDATSDGAGDAGADAAAGADADGGAGDASASDAGGGG